MAQVTLTELLQRIEAHILAAPSLGVTIADDLRGLTSATRRHKGVGVWRESTLNTEQYRDQDNERVEDRVIVELSYRIAPKDQRTSRDAASDLMDTIRDRITELSESTLAKHHPRHLEDREEITDGEWLVIQSAYRFTRDQSVGAG